MCIPTWESGSSSAAMGTTRYNQHHGPRLHDRTYVALQTSLVYYLINVVCRYTRLCFPRSNVQHLSRKPTDLAHALNLLRIQHGNLIPANKLLFGAGNAVFGVVGQLDARRDLPSLRERVHGPKRSSVRVGGEGIEGAGGWIGVRNDFGSKDVGENSTL